jgi:ABC-type multidrug transport system fused ATPase/permease subunit
MLIAVQTIKFIINILPKKYHLKLLGVGILLMLNSVLELLGLGAILPVFSVLLEDNVVEKYTWAKSMYSTFSLTDERQLIIILAIALFLTILIKNLISLYINKINSTFALGLFKDFAIRLHKHYYKEGFSYFKTTNSNIIVRNLRTATAQFSKLQVLGTLNLLNEFVVLTLIVTFIAIYNFKILLLLALTVIPPFYIFYRWVRHKSIELGEISNRINPILGKNMFQSIFGFVDVVIAGAEKSFRKDIKNNLDELVEVDIKTTIYNLAPTKVIETSLMLAIAVIISFGMYFLPSKTDLIKLLGLFAVAGYRIMPSINRMMIAINGLNSSRWIFPILEPLKFNAGIETQIQDKAINFYREIKLDGVSFAYPDQSKLIFNNFNLSIKKGEVIGLVGPSGAGKTTLMNILLGFLKPTAGNYFIDDVVLDNEHIKDFYSKVGYVQQQVYLIDGTIAENVAFGSHPKDIDYQKLETVLKKANLWDMVKALPKTYNELIGENGTKLSGGQRQRVGIARALYFDSEILFFDEATSSLDSETEKEITSAINDISDGSLTIIIIAHRMTTLEHCDRIIEINNSNLQ